MTEKQGISSRSLLLHNIRSAHNVGSLFRTADGVGVEHIILSGYTPDPVDRFGRARNDIAKTALGAEQTLSWEHIVDPLDIVSRYQNEGVQVVAIEQHSRALDYREVEIVLPTLCILGNEVEGLPDIVCDAVDIVAEIPLRGTKESLNVSVAGGVALFQFFG